MYIVNVRHSWVAGCHLLKYGSMQYTVRAANDPLVFTITVKAPTRAFDWMKALT